MFRRTLSLASLLPLLLSCAACSRNAPAPAAGSSASSAPAASASAPPAPSASASAAASASAKAAEPPPVVAGQIVTPRVVVDTTAGSPGEWKVSGEGLPAASVDGKTVVYLFRKEDGLRGYPNGTLVVRRVDGDKSDKELLVLDPAEMEKAEDAPNASGTTLPALKKRVASRADEANELLAKGMWKTLASGVAPKEGAALPAAVFRSDGLEVTLDGGKLVAKAEGKARLEVDAKAWAAKPYTVKGMSPCTFTPGIEALGADAKRGILWVRIAERTSAGDHCNATGQAHAFRLKD